MSPPEIEFHPEAIAEARAAREWYARHDPVVGDAFMAELDRAVDLIIAGPAQWPPHLHDTRRFLLRRFPYSVVYRDTGRIVQVLAVAHARREPGYWRTRTD